MFVVVDRMAIIMPAILALQGRKRIELVVAKSASSADEAVEGRLGAIALVSMLRDDGPERAVRLASKGARVVICVGGSPDRRPELRQRAPASLILKVGTADQLARILRTGPG